jgi:hypothetical protein
LHANFTILHAGAVPLSKLLPAMISVMLTAVPEGTGAACASRGWEKTV